MPRAASTLTKSKVTASSTNRPLPQKDPMWRPGTKTIVDFTDEFGANGLPVGAVAVGAAVQDLGLNPLSAVFTGGGNMLNLASSGGLSCTGGGTAQRFKVGNDGDVTIPVDHEFLLLIEMKQTSAAGGNVPLAFIGPSSTANGNPTQAFISSGTSGITPTVQVGTGTGVNSQALPANSAMGSPTQIGLGFRPSDGRIMAILNGAVYSFPTVGAMNLLDPTGMALYVTSRLIGTFYRIEVIDMTEAIATETAWGYASTDILDAAAHANKSYRFCRNLLPEAPRAALV